MVGGLVQQQEIGFGEHQLEKQHPGPLPAGKGAHRLEHVLPFEEEHRQSGAHLGLGKAGMLVPNFIDDGFFVVEALLGLLVIPHVQGGTKTHKAGVRGVLPQKDFEEGGLAAAVGPQKKHLLPPLDLQAHLFKQLGAPKGEAQVLRREHVVAAAAAGVKLKADGVRLLLRLFQGGLQPVNLLLLAGDGHIVALLVPPALLLNNALNAGDLLLGVLILPLHGQAVLCPQLQVPAVVAFIGGEGLSLHFQRAAGDLVQKVAVVGNDNIGSGVSGQKALQPLYSLDVQVVGGLVQQQQVGAAQQHLGQLQLGLLPAGKDPHPALQLVLRKAQAQQGAAGPRPAGEAPRIHKPVVEVGLAQDEPLHVFLPRVGGEKGVQILQFPFHAEQGGKDGHNLLQGGLFQVPADVLFHVAQHRVLAEHHRACVGGILPGEHLKEGGFAASVDPHQAHALPLLHFKGDIPQDDFLSKALLYMVYCYNRHCDTPLHSRKIYAQSSLLYRKEGKRATCGAGENPRSHRRMRV